MKIRYLKMKQWLLVTLGGLLGMGVTSCMYGTIECEYGCPEGTYHVKGTVTNSKGEPVEGIGVASYHYPVWEGDSISGHDVGYYDTTGPDGRYDVSVHAMPGEVYKLDFGDIDGAQHGAYHDTIIPVSAQQEDFHGGDGNWNYGTADIDLDVTLKEKTNK